MGNSQFISQRNTGGICSESSREPERVYHRLTDSSEEEEREKIQEAKLNAPKRWVFFVSAV